MSVVVDVVAQSCLWQLSAMTVRVSLCCLDRYPAEARLFER